MSICIKIPGSKVETSWSDPYELRERGENNARDKRPPPAECLRVSTKTSPISLKWKSSHNSYYPFPPTFLALQECEVGPRRSDAQEPGAQEFAPIFPDRAEIQRLTCRQTESEIISQNRTLTQVIRCTDDLNSNHAARRNF
jgi:hypothetical protein